MRRVAINHPKSIGGCGNVAFYYFGPVYRGAMLHAKYAEYPPGSLFAPAEIRAGNFVFCGSCLKPLSNQDVNDGFCDSLADLLGVPKNDNGEDIYLSDREFPQEHRDIPSTDGDSE